MEQQFPHIFNAADLGQSLKEVSTEILHTTHQDVVSRWFHSSKDADLFIWSDLQKNIIKQQLSYYGQVVEWNVVEGIKTGHVVIDESHRHARGSSEILHFDVTPQLTNIHQALALMDHVSGLKDEERQALKRNFSATGPWLRVSPEEYRQRFAAFLPPQRPVITRASIFKRLVTKVSGWFKP